MMMKNLGGAGGADPSAAGGAGGLASLLGKSFTFKALVYKLSPQND